MPLIAYSFGPFRLDLKGHRLLREGRQLDVSVHLVDVLTYLVSHAGELVTREQLLEALWPGIFVTDNTVSRAISDLRHALGDPARDSRYIQTAARRGYRFVANVVAEHDGDTTNSAQTAPDAHDTAQGDPASDREWSALRDLVELIPDLETFDLEKLPAARERLRATVAELPRYAPAYVALASAATLAFEATRATSPDRDALAEAVSHARTACRLTPGLAEAWGTLAFALTVGGVDADEARAAARRAVMIDGGSWRHHFRLAYASWGDERLRAVTRTLDLMPGMPFACFAGAMVHVARGARSAALKLLNGAAIPSLDGQWPPDIAPPKLPAVGVDWLAGAVLGASADESARGEAEHRLDREIAAFHPHRLYSREFTVNAWHWRAGWAYRDGNLDAALSALQAALDLEPAHGRSAVALAALARDDGRAEARWDRAAELITTLHAAGRSAEAATCGALRALLKGDRQGAADILDGLLAQAPAGQTGWTIPIDPWLSPLHGTPAYEHLLWRLAQRAA